MANKVPISATPVVGQLVEHEGKTFQTIREGNAYILVPPNTQTSVDPKAKAKSENGEAPQNVFYNPIQQFNRDLSVLAIRAFGDDLCEKRRLRHEKDNEKQQAKKERKRRRNQEAREGDEDGNNEKQQANGTKRKRDAKEEDEDATDRPVKLHKADDAPAMPVENIVRDDVVHGPPGSDAVPAQDDAVDADRHDLVPSAPSADEMDVETVAEDKATIAPAVQPPDDGKAAAPPDGVHEQQTKPQWRPRLRILDALSASGLRALRYASEIPAATAITANDMDRNAVNSIKMNAEHNKLTEKINVNLGNAIGYMYSAAFPPTHSHGPHHVSYKYDVIDLDPYGTAAPFIDAALQALNDGGLLCVTCTDSGVFASCGYAEKTYALYGGMPVKGTHSHEGGLRLIINSVATAAARYGLAIEPLLSLSIDFYARIFIRVTKSPADVKFLAGKTMIAYGCDAGCGAWYTQMLGRNTRQTGNKAGGKVQENNPTFNFKHSIAQAPSADRLCEHCGSKMHVAGPMWGGSLHNAAFVEKVLGDAKSADRNIYGTTPRLEGMLDTALDELIVVPEAESLWQAIKRENGSPEMLPKTPPEAIDTHPFFFIPSALAKVIHCVAPPEAAIKGALRHSGYKATRSHCKPGSIKTDAPWSAIWEIMREWVRQKQPIKEGALKEGLAGWKIMQAARKPEEQTNGHKEGEGSDEVQSSDAPEIVTDATSPPVQKPSEPKRMKVVFDEVLGKDKPGKKLVRYQQNPRENWGPMQRAKGSG